MSQCLKSLAFQLFVTLFNSLLKLTAMKSFILLALCEGNPSGFPSQRARNVENISMLSSWYWYSSVAGLGRVPDLRVRVQVRVLVICVSTSPSTWLLHEYESEYEYWLMSKSTSTSTGLWSTFYIACIGSRFLLFGLWQESPQILTNLGQSSNCPLSL